MADQESTRGKRPLPRKPMQPARSEPGISRVFEPIESNGLGPPLPLPQKNSGTGETAAWYRGNAGIAMGAVVGVFVVLLIALGWQLRWFGGEKSPRQSGSGHASLPPAPVSPTALVAPPPPPPIVSPPAVSTTPPVKSAQGALPGSAKTAVAVVPLPPDVKKWKKADYLRARRENHPRLIEAVAYLGTVNVESAAQMLIDLLRPLSADKVVSGGVGTSGVSGAQRWQRHGSASDVGGRFLQFFRLAIVCAQ